MKTIIKIAMAVIAMVDFLPLYSQIGYQVAVVDQATGNPKANNQVEVSISLLDNAGNVICNTNETLMTNDFGVISVSVGNSSTFDDFDWTKLPLWISAKVDGIDMGKTQVLTVPVAEHAKHTGTLTKDLLCSKNWKYSDYELTSTLSFNKEGIVTLTNSSPAHNHYATYSGSYNMEGNMVLCDLNSEHHAIVLIWSSEINSLFPTDGESGVFK